MTDVVLNQVTEIAKLGFPGALLIIAGWWIWMREQYINLLVKERIEDWKKLADIISNNNQTISAAIAASEARTRLSQEMIEGYRITTRTQEATVASLKEMNVQVDRLSDVTQKLREAFISRGAQL